MMIDTTTKLKSYRNETLKREDKNDLTIGHVIEVACLAQLKDDESLGFEAKVKLLKLAAEAAKPKAEFSLPECTQIMERIGKVWPPIVCGPVKDVFDPPAQKAESSLQEHERIMAKRLDGTATGDELTSHDAYLRSIS